MGLEPRIATGLPAGTKARPRTDFVSTEFDQAIQTKGYKMWWSRAGVCPCRNNPQTDQPDPTCSLCGGNAYFYFLPDPALPSATEDKEGNPIELNDAKDAVMIRVLMTQLTKDVQVFEKFGEWVLGMARMTTQPGNNLGYHDRLTAIDSEMVWAQLVEADGTNEIPIVGSYKAGQSISKGLRYGFVTVNLLRSKATTFKEGVDFGVGTLGKIAWKVGVTPPVSGTILSIHGTVRPQWAVMDHMHILRDTQIEGTDVSIKAQQFRKLPVQVVAKLDFLVED